MTDVERWQAEPTTVFDAAEIDLDAFRWIARPVIVFAVASQDPAFIEQMDLIESEVDDLAQRDVLIITDTTPSDPSDIRTRFRPRGFQLTLVGKDGEVNLRKPFPWHVREITRSIDKMPMRQREMQEGG